MPVADLVLENLRGDEFSCFCIFNSQYFWGFEMSGANVRVRGIYATAISKILLERGFKIVDASEKIAERFSMELDTEPADVTVKCADVEDEILVMGSPREALQVYSVLIDVLRYVYTLKSSVELYAVYKGLIVEKIGDYCVVDLGDVKGQLTPCREEPGESVIVGIKRAPLRPGEKALLTRNFMIRGKVLALVHGDPRITFSEHIRDSRIRARLSTLALSKLMGTGLGAHFRSSSKYASDNVVLEEIDKLLAEYRDLVERARSLDPPVKLRQGEFIGLIGVTSLAKKLLDEIRSCVVTTVNMHHSLKSSGLSDLVDFVESIVTSDVCKREVSSRLLNYIGNKLRERREVEFVHIKPTGERIPLGGGEVLDVLVGEDFVQLLAKRVIKSSGVYDGLGVEKKPGDIDYVIARSDQPILVHNYYRGEEWLGSYININTPPEITPSQVKYHDLLVDVVVLPSGEVKVVDEEELEKAHREEILTESLYSCAKNTLKLVLEKYREWIYNPRSRGKI